MSLFFFAVAGFTLGGGVRVDEDDSATPVVVNFDSVGADGDSSVGNNTSNSSTVGDTPYKYPCTTTTTTTTTCTGADCVNKYWPWSTEANIGGTTINPPKSASLLEENEHGIGGDIVGDIERLGHDVEYEATHLGGPGTGHATATAAPVARSQQSSEKHVIAKHPGGVQTGKGKHGENSAEALIDEILDGDNAGSTTTAPGSTTAAGTTASGTTTGSATGTATTAGTAEALLQKASTTPTEKFAATWNSAKLVQQHSAATTTTPCPTAVYGDDLASLRKRLDGLSCK